MTFVDLTGWIRTTRDGEPIVRVTCPECGMNAALDVGHYIDALGHVTPSLDCPECDFHEFVRLIGWRPRLH